jgi:flagellar hook-associated protein 3 FlgL
MSITGPGSITATNLLAQNNMMSQLNTLSQQLGTGQAATTYSGLGSQAGLAVQLNAQLAAIGAYSNTANTVGTTLTIAQSVLNQLASAGNDVQTLISQQGSFTLDNNGQTATQSSAASYLDQIISLLNTEVGGNYLFSGSAVNDPAVASTSDILNGTGTQAGLTQVIAARLQADEGTDGLGRLNIPTVPPSSSTVTISQDATGSPFGFQLAGVTSTLTGATVSGPSGAPPSISVDLGSNPSAGQSISFDLTLPDGSSQTITLQATTASPPGANQFTIGTDADATAGNLQAALTSAVSNLAQTALPAASAIAAANNFFSIPPQVISGDPYTATSLSNGTSANTVLWYTGGNSSTPLQTVTAQVGPSLTVAYGMQANEPAISSLLASVAVLAATSYSPTDTNAQASYQALCQSVTQNLSSQSGSQSINDIEANIVNAQTTVQNATAMNTQTQNSLQDMLQGFEGVNQNQIGEDILTLQNDLSASMSVTARLAQMSLVNYLSPVSG